jgi:catechol 2,3-dioxygenase-like lactoylglutathione lyase family enzyme
MLQSFGLSHIQITVSDLEKSMRFYEKLFGMKELFRIPQANTVMMQTPGTHEVFTINGNPKHAQDIGKMAGIAHFGFRLKEPIAVNALIEMIIEAGGTEIEHGTRMAGDEPETWLFTKDPDGYDVEIFWVNQTPS